MLHIIHNGVVMPECEGCAACDNADEHHGEWNVQVYRHGRINDRETDEQDHDSNDQPHMISFPDRPDGRIKRFTGNLLILREVKSSIIPAPKSAPPSSR
jgi:hypothetical protein